jgi:hypothetical protein
MAGSRGALLTISRPPINGRGLSFHGLVTPVLRFQVGA